MHQQPQQAPRLPNSSSKSSHVEGISGWKVINFQASILSCLICVIAKYHIGTMKESQVKTLLHYSFGGVWHLDKRFL